MKDIFESIEKALDLLVSANRDMAKIWKDIDYAADNNHAFVSRNILTVRLDIGRLSGKTTLIEKRLAEDELSIMVADEKQCEWSRARVPDRIFSVSDVIGGSCKNVAYRTVYIDNPRFIAPCENELFKIYTALAKDYETQFILLG